MRYYCEECRRWDKEIEDVFFESGLEESPMPVRWAAVALMMAMAGVVWVEEWVDEF